MEYEKSLQELKDSIDQLKLAQNEMMETQLRLNNLVSVLMDKMIEKHIKETKLEVRDLDKDDAEYQAENCALESEMDNN